MGSIFVQGIGEVEIAGDTPTPEEQSVIASSMTQPEDSGRINSRWSLAGDAFKKGMIDLLSNVSHLPGGQITKKEVRDEYDKIAGVKDIIPEDKIDEYIESISRFAGASVIPGTGVIAKSSQKALAAVTEVSSTLFGGAGAVLGGDIAEQLEIPREYGEVGGGLVGGILPIASQGLIQKGVAKGRQLLKKESQEAFARNQARQEIESAIATDPRAQANLQRAEQLKQDIPGFEPMLPQAVGAPGIVALGKRVAERTTENLNKTTIRMDQNIDAIQRKFETDFPEAAIDAIKPARETLKRTELSLESDLTILKTQQDELAERFSRKLAPEIGEELRELRIVAKDAARAVKNSKYIDAYEAAEAQGVRVRVDDVYDDVRSIIRSADFQETELPFVFKQVISKYKPAQSKGVEYSLGKGITGQRQIDVIEPTTVDFPEFHSLIRQTNKEIGAARAANDPTKEYFLIKLSKKLERKLEPLRTGDFGAKLNEADRFWLEDYHNVFRKGVGGKMERFNRFGEITPDEKIVSDLAFKSKASLAQFRRLFQDTPEATELLIDGTLDMFSKAAVRDGIIKPNLAKTFLRKHKHILDDLPEVSGILRNADSLNDALLLRQSEVSTKMSALAKSRLSKITKIDNVDDAIEKALKDPKEMFALMGSARKSPEGRKALARAVADHVKSKPNPYQYILENEKNLSMALNPLGKDHLKNLKVIAEAEEILARAKPPTTVDIGKTIHDPLERRIGTTVKSVISQLRAAAQGRVSQQYVFSDISGKFIFKIQQDEAQRLLEAAIFDPDISKTLAGLATRETMTKIQSNRIRNHLYSLGIKSIATTEQSE